MAKTKVWTDLSQALGFLTSIYILIRGFDNYGKALTRVNSTWHKERNAIMAAPSRVLNWLKCLILQRKESTFKNANS